MTNLLSTFYLLFETDAKKATGEIRETEAATDALADSVEKVGKVDADRLGKSMGEAKRQTGLAAGQAGKLAEGVDKVSDKTKQAAVNSQELATGFVSAAKSILAPLAALLSIGTVAAGFSAMVADVRELDQTATKLRSNVSDVDAFRRAVVAAGGDTAGATDSLVKFGEKLNEAADDAKSAAAKDFKDWGFALKNANGEAINAADGMVRLAKSLEGVSQAQALARLKKLGIEDAATIELILKGAKAVEERIKAEKALGVVTDNQARKVRDYQALVGRLGNAFESFKNRVFSNILPAVIRGFEKLNAAFEWMGKNETLVKGFLIGIAGVLTAVYLPAVIAATASTLLFLAPWIAIGAAIAAVGVAVALVYEDVNAFLNGQNSLLGELAKKYPAVQAAIDAVGVAIRAGVEAYEAIKAAGGTALEALGKAWEVAKAAVNAYLKSIQPLVEAVQEAIGLAGDIASALGAKLWDGVTAYVQGLQKVFKTVFTAIFGDAVAFKGDMLSIGQLIGEAWNAAAGLIGKVWDSMISTISSGIKSAVSGLREILGLAGQTPAGGMPIAPADVNAASSVIGATQRGQVILQGAAGTPINQQSGRAMTTEAGASGPVSVDKSTSLQTGDITINTQATDAKGIAAQLQGALRSEIRQTQSNLDDGVDR